jgi:hypothetical protein
VTLLGLVPASMNLAIGTSPVVRASLAELVERIVAEAHGLGFVFQPIKDAADARDPRLSADVAHLAGLR